MTSADGDSSHRKLALIIGNNKYKREENRRKYSVGNARKLSNLLTTIKFDVTTHYNVDKNIMKNISTFADTIMDGDLVLFYFSGHCRQVAGENYLIPIDDDRIEGDNDVKDIGARATHALERLTEKNKSFVTIFILDCCKQYLLKNESTINVQSKGLKEMSSSDETFIQLACAANQTVINDGKTKHSNLFNKHLLENITREDICIPDMFQQVVDDVIRESNGKQQPLSINGLHQHGQVCLYHMPDDVMINDCNKRIGDLKVELDDFTLKGSQNGSVYDPVIGCRIGEIRALIHTLTLKRNRAIGRRFSSFPIK